MQAQQSSQAEGRYSWERKTVYKVWLSKGSFEGSFQRGRRSMRLVECLGQTIPNRLTQCMKKVFYQFLLLFTWEMTPVRTKIWLRLITVLCLPVYLLVPIHFHMSSAGVFQGGCRCLGFPFHFSLFVASSLNLWGWWYAWPSCRLLKQSSMGDCFHLHCQAGGWDHIGCASFMDGGRTLLDSQAPPWLIFGNWAMSLHYEIWWFAVFFSES